MLDFLRRGVKTWVAKALLGLLILSFAVWGIGAEIFTFNLSTGVARVGDTKVTAERFINEFQRQQNELTQRSGQVISTQMMRDLDADDQILERLMREAAYQEELTRMGVRVPDEAALEAVRQRPEFQSPDGSLSAQAVRFTLSRLGITEDEFLDQNRIVVGANLLTGAPISPTTSPPGVAARIATYRGETRRVATITLGLDQAGEPGEPTEGGLTTFYENNPTLFTEPERRWGRLIYLDFEALVADLQPSEEEVAAVYEAELETLAVPASAEIDQLSMPDLAAAEAAVARIRSGEITFEQLVEEQGQSLADTDLGQVGASDLPAATAEAVFAATEPGVLDPIALPVGTAIVRVRTVTEAGFIPLATLRDQLADRIARDLAYQRAPGIANQMEELRAGGATLPEIAEATDLPLIEFDGIGPDGTFPYQGLEQPRAEGILLDPRVAGEIRDALDAEERPLLETDAGDYVLVAIDRIEPRGLQPLDAVRERAVDAWKTGQRLDDLMIRAGKTADLIDNGATLAALASAIGVPLGTPDPFTRITGPEELPEEIVTDAFDNSQGNGLAARLPDGTGVMVAEVTQRIELPAEVTAETAAEIDEVLQQSIRTDAAEMYIRAILADYETGTDPDALEEAFGLLQGHGLGGGGY